MAFPTMTNAPGLCLPPRHPPVCFMTINAAIFATTFDFRRIGEATLAASSKQLIIIFNYLDCFACEIADFEKRAVSIRISVAK